MGFPVRSKIVVIFRVICWFDHYKQPLDYSPLHEEDIRALERQKHRVPRADPKKKNYLNLKSPLKCYVIEKNINEVKDLNGLRDKNLVSG